jgi:hypothetical protein
VVAVGVLVLADIAHRVISDTRRVRLEQHDPSSARASVRLALRPCYHRLGKTGVVDMRTRSKPDHHRSIALMLATLGCAVAIAACGSSGKSSGGSGSSGRSSGIAFASCMRAHGINIPDPGSGGGGIQLPAGANPQSPGFQSAQKACFKLLPGGGPGRGQPASQSQNRNKLAMSESKRRHGLSTIPDPVSPPQPGNGLGLAFGAPGSFIVIPQALINSPAFNQAAAACGLPGAGAGHVTS